MDKAELKQKLAIAAEKIESSARTAAEWAGKTMKPLVEAAQQKIKERREEAMAMKRCESGHYYDAGKSPQCPLCQHARESGGSAGAAPKEEIKNMPPRLGEQTVSLMVKEHGVEAVVGWLVCVDGPDKGRDFRIRSEKNFIGRAPQMDIALTQDDTISRENHATVIFNPKKKSFKLLPGGGRGLVYINGEEVLEPTDLSKGDKIDLGKTQLLFVPFAGDIYDWGDTTEHTPAGKSSSRG